MSRVTVSVIIPALNEELNLPHVLPRVPSIVDEIILVDGASVDRTADVARELIPSIRVVQQEGKGKGAALRSGFAAATGDIIVMLDADGSTDPAEIPMFVNALLAGADYAKGSRFLHGAGTSDMPIHRRMGNATFVRLVRILYGGRYTDLCYGYNAFWRKHLPALDLNGDGFEIETEMNIRALRAGLRVLEVPSFEDRRVMGIGNLRTIPDGWRVLRAIFRERRRPLPAAALATAATNGRTPPGLQPVPMVADRVVSGNGHNGGDGNGSEGTAYPPLAELAAASAIGESNGFAYLVASDGHNGETHNGENGNGTSGAWAGDYVDRLHALLASLDRHAVDRMADELLAARLREATIFIAGNGGSSATAAHWVNDLAKATRRPDQPPMRVMNLTDNVPWLTALANDEGYDRVFAGQLENLAREGDVLVVISASGNSPNILRAIEHANASGLLTMGLLGFDGGEALPLLDAAVWLPTRHGEYGLVETAHSAVADMVTARLAVRHASAPTTS
jgi:phosphoheptose isomerase